MSTDFGTGFVQLIVQGLTDTVLGIIAQNQNMGLGPLIFSAFAKPGRQTRLFRFNQVDSKFSDPRMGQVRDRRTRCCFAGVGDAHNDIGDLIQTAINQGGEINIEVKVKLLGNLLQ